ncbi:hypothetical protein F0562_008712 [Nyssa sinensis]|uniref:cysteine synthase n=1 Tax=Nyssa sinensis TaxID=561372 RepID=A0A5J5A9U7_9ASTE|nr:hypothetical protein F0562_008712 [Nyssa sinensis]
MAPVAVRTTGAIVAALSIALASYFFCDNHRSKASFSKLLKSLKPKKPRNGLIDAIGNTPLIRINSLSEATGCEILGKAEFLNPGGSVKDRVAVKIIEEALETGELAPGGVVTEGSAGSTAISLATVAPAYGCKCHVVIPDDVAIEKSQILEALGATVERVRPVSITHKDHYVNIARRRALGANVASQHRKSNRTDVNDVEQINGYTSGGLNQSSLFSSDCKAAGTGGTVAGVSRFLKEKNPSIRCFLIDPPGSGLFNKVTRGVMYTKEEAEGRRLKNPFDTITEGIGINRLTQNFIMAELDGAFRGFF